MTVAKQAAHLAVTCALLAGCGRTGFSSEGPLDESGGTSASGASASGASASDASAGAAGTSGGGAAGTAPMQTCADLRCDDGDPCNGSERCDASSQRCEAGTPFACPAHERCVPNHGAASCDCVSGYVMNGAGVCLPVCDVPSAPVISVIDDAEVLHFTAEGDFAIETAIQAAGAPTSAALYAPLEDVPLQAQSGLTRVLARVNDARCVAGTPFDAVYDVRATCAPAEHEPTTTALPKADPSIVGWATAVQNYQVGPGVTQLMFTDPNAALGPAQGTSTAVVSLGNGGEISLSFASPIRNGPSWDFAVFENAFNDTYLELGFVEVSSDGSNFLRFDSAFLGTGPASSAYAGDARKLCGIAGSYAAGFGTPFDLDALRNAALVRTGVVDLNAIRYVRVVDIVGDGDTRDSFGRPIFDPNPSSPAAGFDLDAIAVLHNEASP